MQDTGIQSSSRSLPRRAASWIRLLQYVRLTDGRRRNHQIERADIGAIHKQRDTVTAVR
jgi:hypothetical protein